MHPDLLILTSNPFSQRDEERFGLSTLTRQFRVRVIDCAAWLHPSLYKVGSHSRALRADHVVVGNWSDFQAALGSVGDCLAIDYTGLEPFRTVQAIHRELNRRGIRRTILRVCSIPSVPLGFLEKVQLARKDGKLGRQIWQKLSRVTQASIRAEQEADISILSGAASEQDPRTRTTHRIWAHSFDYDLYLRLRRSSAVCAARPYAVFLDEDMAYHPDYMLVGYGSPVSADSYYGALNRFFAHFELKTRLRTIVAAHPLSKYEERPDLFPGREVVRGRTAELVRDAAVVFAHASTALSFAVLWEKPVLFLTTGELERSFMRPQIALRSELLKAPLVNVEEPGALSEWVAPSVVDSAYQRYVEEFIKIPGTPELPLWEIFCDYVRKNLH